jgi:hypothetical protein
MQTYSFSFSSSNDTYFFDYSPGADSNALDALSLPAPILSRWSKARGSAIHVQFAF